MSALRQQWLDYLRTPLGNDAGDEAEPGSSGDEPVAAEQPDQQDPDR